MTPGTQRIGIHVIKDSGDARGSSFPVPRDWSRFISTPADLHVTSLLPGHVRGNHYHIAAREVILIHHRDRWSLYWEEEPGGPVSRRDFDGTGLVLLTVEPGTAHAVGNSGAEPLLTFGLIDRLYDPADTVRRVLVPPP
jgi:dTDP-4-dehydrorhamnose 3,5-epimerase-like enzyme